MRSSEYNKVNNRILDILDNRDISKEEIRKRLNKIEKKYPQFFFIKTNLCECGKLKVEIWEKNLDVSL